MKFKDIISKIFKVKNNKIQSIANITDVVILPSREEFKENSEIMSLIDNYKKEYRNKLLSRILTSNDLNLEDLSSEMNMDIDLLLNVTMNESNSQNEQLEKIIKYLKLNQYLEEINKLDIKNKAMLIALEELQHDIRYFFSKNKRNAILNEINTLAINMNIFASQKRAVELETNSYLLNVELPDYAWKDFKREATYLNHWNDVCFLGDAINYYDKIAHQMKKIFPEVFNNIESKETSTIKKIVLYERFLEIYVYRNKDKIEELKHKIAELEQKNITYDNYENITSELENINFYFQIFMKYGRNLVKEEDLYNLYKIKFDLITYEINTRRCIIYIYKLTRNQQEYEIYKKIVSDKISAIINGISPVAHIFEEHNLLKDLLKILIPLFKTGKYFDIDKIFQDRELLSYLLAFDSEMRFKELFDINYNALNLAKSCSTSDLREDYNLNFYSTCLELKDELSLKTLCWFIDLNLKMKEKIKIPSFYKIYMLYEKTKRNENMYEFPKEIIGIKRDNVYDNLIMKIIRKDMKNKTVVIPSTVNIFRGNWFTDIKIDGLIFEEGIEEIYHVYFSDLKKVIIPSTLEPYYSYLIQSTNLKTLGFTNFQNSKFLNRLLNSSDIYHYPYLLSLFKVQLNKNLENQIIPVFNQLLLYDSKNTEYVIDSQDLVIDIGRNVLNKDSLFTDKDLLLKYGFVYIGKEQYMHIKSLLEMYKDENISRIFIKKKEEINKIIQEHLLKVIEEKTGVNFKEYNKEKCLKKR